MANPRKAALNALLRIEKDNAYSNIILGEYLSDGNFSVVDRAFATALFYGVLDRKITLDYVLGSHMPKHFSKIKPYTATVLRLGAYQIMYMDKVPDSAAVNESVNLIKQSKEKFNVSFVNAVLRSISRDGYSLPDGNDIKSLSIRYSCPESTVKIFTDDYGAETAEKILSEFLKPSTVFIRTNTLLTDDDKLVSVLQKEGISAKPTDIKHCLSVSGKIDFKFSPAFLDGLFHVQDITSQICASKLEAKPGERILDTCASPGGKSFTMAEIMNGNGEIVSCDVSENRVSLISKGAKRLKIGCIKPLVNDASVNNPDFGKFDRILCDVPCSGLGVLRRKPEIKYKQFDDFDNLQKLQYKILTVSSQYLKNGGTLVYSTCTLRKNENEWQVERFITENPDFSLAESVTFLPNEEHDGFFVAKLIKNS